MGWIANLFGAQDLQAEGDALDAKLQAANERDYGPGGRFYSAANWSVVQQDMKTGATGDVTAQINDAFDSGLKEGAGNVTGAFSGVFDIFGQGIGAVLKSIPWWVWGAVALYFLWPFIARKLIRA